jgi:hypothetical protein
MVASHLLGQILVNAIATQRLPADEITAQFQFGHQADYSQ